MSKPKLRRARRNVALSLAVTPLLVLAAACGGDDAGTTGTGGATAGGGGGGDVLVGLVTKTDTNPFFVKMKEGATKAATEQGVELQSFAGKKDGDNQSQVDAIENLIGAGAKGILLTPNDP